MNIRITVDQDAGLEAQFRGEYTSGVREVAHPTDKDIYETRWEYDGTTTGDIEGVGGEIVVSGVRRRLGRWRLSFDTVEDMDSKSGGWGMNETHKRVGNAIANEPVSERLRTILNEADPHSTCEEAADLLDEQAARIAELEAEVERMKKDMFIRTRSDLMGRHKAYSGEELRSMFGPWFSRRDVTGLSPREDRLLATIELQAIQLYEFHNAAGDEDPVVLIEAAKKLPKTADGVRCAGDMKLFGISAIDGEIIEIDRNEYGLWIADGEGEQWDLYEFTYSTREAAEAAKAVGDAHGPEAHATGGDAGEGEDEAGDWRRTRHPGRPVVYVAGPYSSDPVAGLREAAETGAGLYAIGCAPIVPHASLVLDLIEPQPYETWLEIDLALVRRADAVYRIGGASAGADREVKLARELGIPVLRTGGGVHAFLYHWNLAEAARGGGG